MAEFASEKDLDAFKHVFNKWNNAIWAKLNGLAGRLDSVELRLQALEANKKGE